MKTKNYSYTESDDKNNGYSKIGSMAFSGLCFVAE